MRAVYHWLKHLRAWLFTFPVGDYHVFCSMLGEAEEVCFICQKKIRKSQKILEGDLKILNEICPTCGKSERET